MAFAERRDPDFKGWRAGLTTTHNGIAATLRGRGSVPPSEGKEPAMTTTGASLLLIVVGAILAFGSSSPWKDSIPTSPA